MSARIKDQFSALPLTKHQRYVARQKVRGKCTKCPSKAVKWGMCKRHVAWQQKRDAVSYRNRIKGNYVRGPYEKAKA